MLTVSNSTNCRPTKILGFDPTPLWNHVHVISTSSGGGNRVWTCNYCNKKVTGSYTKVKGHLLRLAGHGVESCKLISDEEYCQVKNEYDEAEANKEKEFRDRQRKKECFISLPEYFDLVHYKRRRGVEVSDLGERNRSSNIVENILAIPESEQSFLDLVKRRKLQPKKRKVVKEATPEKIVSTRFSGRNFHFLYDDDYQKVETDEGEDEGHGKERGDHEETIIKMCAKVKKTTSGTPASLAPSATELLGRRILKKTTGDNKPLTSGKSNFQIEINPNFCDFREGTSSIKPDLDQFYFPAAKEYLSKLRAVDVLAESAAYNIQSLQGILAMKEHLEELEAKLEVAKESEKIYKEKSEEDAKTILSLRKRINTLEAYGKKKEDEVLDCAGYYTFKTKADLMKDFLDGKTDEWDPEKDIQIWEKNFAEMTPPVTENNFDIRVEEENINSFEKPSSSLERDDLDF